MGELERTGPGRVTCAGDRGRGINKIDPSETRLRNTNVIVSGIIGRYATHKDDDSWTEHTRNDAKEDIKGLLDDRSDQALI